ncbi:hypothetical protein CFC21_032218 [Triticum aestivum]|uniref:RRM domain-containing protein n=2 Tax=Triticum aestivum TaxID=4565 RepID=A0A9R1JIR8_WHEAT|nr:polyadenylate-binding protein RBP45-like isoform X1 [Triticum aestivum]KAF7018986.1 hypothetical protein CFC21_032218 [Triticum aestivum]
MARADGSGYCGLAQGFLASRSPPSGRARDSGGRGRGPAVPDVVVISSDEEEEGDGSAPVARKLRFGDGGPTGGSNLALVKKGKCDGEEEEDGDCVVLDSDPDGPVAIVKQEGSSGFDGSLDELLVVAEKGQVACRDFPHSRHLCSSLPFGTTSHVRHCTMCYCFVCDVPAPCKYWGKGLSTDDHCHGTDDEMSWKILRQTFRLGRLTASYSEKYQNAVHPPMAPSTQQYVHHQVSDPQSHPSSMPVLLNAGQTVGAVRASHLTRAERGRGNAHTAWVTRTATPCQQEPYQEEEDEDCTPKVYVGNLHYDVVSEDLAKLFEQAGVVEFSEVIYSRGTGQSRGYGFVTMSTVEEAELAVEMFDGFKLFGMLLIVHKAALRGARVETPSHQSKSAFRIYVGNLPSQVDDSWLEELFSKHGKVVDARVVYERRGGTWSLRGFGFVTMATEEETCDAVYALNKQILEGRALEIHFEPL